MRYIEKRPLEACGINRHSNKVSFPFLEEGLPICIDIPNEDATIGVANNSFSKGGMTRG
jgi:hypothetical protein